MSFKGRFLNKMQFIYLRNLTQVKVRPLPDHPSDPLSISQIGADPFLTPTELDRLRTQIFEDRPLWQKRTSVMWSIGVGAYMHGKNVDSYREETKHWTDILDQKYSWLSEKLFTFLKKKLPHDTRVSLLNAGSRPGFHIFEVRRSLLAPLCFPHFDRQHMSLNLPGDANDYDYDNLLSFTFPIVLPKEDAGLILFDQSSLRSDLWNYSPKYLAHYCIKKMFIKYEVGTLVIQNGNTMHGIYPFQTEQEEPSQWRITYQGHGLYNRKLNEWFIYW